MYEPKNSRISQEVGQVVETYSRIVPDQLSGGSTTSKSLFIGDLLRPIVPGERIRSGVEDLRCTIYLTCAESENQWLVCASIS